MRTRTPHLALKAHTDRWDRALKAFGETVADTSLTAMTAAEAQVFADQGWTRWVSEGDGTFDSPGVDTGKAGGIESTMTTVSPYARLTLTERVSA